MRRFPTAQRTDGVDGAAHDEQTAEPGSDARMARAGDGEHSEEARERLERVLVRALRRRGGVSTTSACERAMRLRTCVQLKIYLTRFSGAETASASAASSACSA